MTNLIQGAAARSLLALAGGALTIRQGGRTPKSGGRMLDGRTWDEFPEVPRG